MGRVPPPARHSVLPRLQILAAAILFSTGGAAIKATSFTGWQVACLRSGIAALTVALALRAARRPWNGRTLAVGTAYAGTLICFVTANKLTTAASTIFLQSTAPFYLVLLGPWLLKERIERRDLLFMAALAVGLLLLLAGAGEPYATAPHPMQGNAIAAASGLFWAFTVSGLRWLGISDACGSPGADEAAMVTPPAATPRLAGGAGGTVAAVVAGNLIAFVVCLPMALPIGATTAADWIVIGYLGVFQIGLAYALLSSAMRHVTALEASLLLLLEPVLNPVFAWLVQGETPGGWSLAGGSIILTACALRTIRSAAGRGRVQEVAAEEPAIR